MVSLYGIPVPIGKELFRETKGKHQSSHAAGSPLWSHDEAHQQRRPRFSAPWIPWNASDSRHMILQPKISTKRTHLLMKLASPSSTPSSSSPNLRRRASSSSSSQQKRKARSHHRASSPIEESFCNSLRSSPLLSQQPDASPSAAAVAATAMATLQARASLQWSPRNLRHRSPAITNFASPSRLSGGVSLRKSLKSACVSAKTSSSSSTPFLSNVEDVSSRLAILDVGLKSKIEGRNHASPGVGVVVTRATASAVAADGEAPALKTPSAWAGVKPLPFVLSVGVGLALRFLVKKPEAVTMQAWQLLAIFASTITGLVLSPLPVGAWAFLGLTVAVLTKTLTFVAAFGAFTNDVIWLIVISFFFARGFVKTGLGDRIATYFVKWLGKSTLGLSYGLALSETLLAPAMPSTTARAGGVFLPIISSLSLSSDSKPKHKSASKLGAYLVMTQFQAAGNSSALFLTAAAQNLLCLKLAQELGVIVANPWLSWFKAASVPAFLALLTTPLILYKLFPPEVKDTPDAPAAATKKLQALGPVTQNEWSMVATMLLAVTLWVFGETLGIASVVAAMLGLCILLCVGVLNWDDCLSEKSAWDTLTWFAVLVGMAGNLSSLGLVKWMSDAVAATLASYSLSWPAAFGVLQATYFVSHYLFASQTGHVGALYSAFLAMHIASGVPTVLAALALAFNTNLFGALTHYSSGQAAVYFGSGYVELKDVFKYGAVMAVWNILVWTVAGGLWWKAIGLY